MPKMYAAANRLRRDKAMRDGSDTTPEASEGSPDITTRVCTDE